ncbi:MAG: hypothetical protein Q7J57_18410 [Gemmobacter sp.]|nr:hypothetical protein [Gemmobacter sp.]
MVGGFQFTPKHKERDMPGPLRSFMIVLWVFCLAGAALVALMTIGDVSVWSFVGSGIFGLLFGIPAGLWTARAIKRDDPNWPRRKRWFPQK